MLQRLLVAILLIFLAGFDGSTAAATEEFCPNEADLGPFVKIGNKLYHFGENKVSWFKANLICRSLNGFLASIENRQESDGVSDYILANYPNDRYWWLSGSDIDVEGDFHWYGTGKRFVFSNWFYPQPDDHERNEDCVQLIYHSGKYRMNDMKCTSWQYFICEASKKIL